MGGQSFKQRQSRYKASFDFGETELTYSFDNSRKKVGATISYHKIPGHAGYRELKAWWLPYVIVFIATFSGIVGVHYYNDYDMAMAIDVAYFGLLMLLCACLAALFERRRGMTSLQLDPVLFILHDGRQDAILEEILARRLMMLRKKFASMDFNRPYYEELGKFRSLWQEGVIDDAEYGSAREKIAAMRDKAPALPPGPDKAH